MQSCEGQDSRSLGTMLMKTLHAAAIGAALASAALVAAPAHAGSTQGKWQIKVLGSYPVAVP